MIIFSGGGLSTTDFSLKSLKFRISFFLTIAWNHSCILKLVQVKLNFLQKTNNLVPLSNTTHNFSFF